MISDALKNALSIVAQILGHPLVFIPFSLFMLISVIGTFCRLFFGEFSLGKREESDDLDDDLDEEPDDLDEESDDDLDEEPDDLDEEPDDLDEEPDDLDEESSPPYVDRRYTVKVKGYNRSLGSYNKR